MAFLYFIRFPNPGFIPSQVLSHKKVFQKEGCTPELLEAPDSSNQAAAMFNHGVPQPEHGKQHSRGSVVLPLL